MSDSTSTKVIQYVSNIKSVEADIVRMKKLNASLAKSVGAEFGKVATVIKSTFAKTAKVKVFDEDGAEKSITVMDQLNTVVKTTSGNYFKLSESATRLANGNKKISTSVTDVTNQFTKEVKVQKQVIKGSSQLATNLNRVSDINAKYANNLKGVGFATKVLARDIPTTSGGIKKMGAIVRTADGRILHLRETIKTLPNGIRKVDRHVSDMSGSFNKVKKTSQALAKSTAGLGANISRLAKRAALTIPLWLAMRSAMTGMISGIKGGFKGIVDFDRALQKLKKNLQGTPKQIKKSFDQAKSSITEFSLISGQSTEAITNAVQKFTTVGFDIETAMSAGINATKLAVLLFGDAEETAQAFARTMNVFIDDTYSAEEAQEKLAGMMALTSELWETNAFEIDEMSSGMVKFAGVAKAMGLSSEQLLVTMSALSSQGLDPKRVNLMRTAFLKLSTQAEKAANIFGIDFNPELDTSFTLMRKVIGELAKMKDATGKISFEGIEVMRDIFQVRGTEVIADWVSGFKEVDNQLNKYLDKKPDIEAFNREFEGTTDQLRVQADRFENVKKEMGKAFVSGLVGAENFNKDLKAINETLEDMIPKLRNAGEGARALYEDLAVTGEVVSKLFNTVASFSPAGVLVKGALNLADDIKETDKALEQAGDTAREFGDGLLDALNGNAELEDLKRTIDGIITRINVDTIDPQMDRGMLFKALVELLKNETDKLGAIDLIGIHARLGKIQPEGVDPNVWNDLREMTKNEAQDAFDKQPIEIEGSVGAKVDVKRTAKVEELLSSELKRLKTLGATEAQILKTEASYVKMLKLSRDEEVTLKKKLSLERAIGEEKRLQGKLGDESMKLYKIANDPKNGPNAVSIARQISQALSGEIDYDAFIARGGDSVDVFKDQFAGLFEQKKAEKFFTKGRGSTISIEEQGLKDKTFADSKERFQQQIQALTMNTKVDVAVQAKLDPSNIDDFANKVGQQVASKLKTKGTALNTSLNEGIDKDKLRREL